MVKQLPCLMSIPSSNKQILKVETMQILIVCPKGKIALPKKIRDFFNKVVVLEFIDDAHTLISVVPDVVGPF